MRTMSTTASALPTTTTSAAATTSSSSLSLQNEKKDDQSFCIVWSPLPPITWLIPFIGHLGITDSRGVASDFRGPYYVGDDGRMAFGAPTRALKLEAYLDRYQISAQQWDDAIRQANEIYRGRMHNICCDNCHSHVANALNRIPFPVILPSFLTSSSSSSPPTLLVSSTTAKWNMVLLAAIVFFRAKFLSWWGVLTQFGPLLLLIFIVVVSTETTTKP